MKIRLLLFIILIIFAMANISCTQENIVRSEGTIYGSWVRHITDSKKLQFNAELKIKTDNRFDFILLENAPGHTNSSGEMTLKGNVITIINDSDCGGDGVYEFVVSEKKLAIVAVDDKCTPRMLALQGVWTKK